MPEVRPEFRAQEFPFEIGGHRRAAFGNNEQPLRVEAVWKQKFYVITPGQVVRKRFG